MHLPPHPEQDDPVARGPEPRDATTATRVFIVIIAALVLAIVVLHLTGVVGPGSH